MTIIIIALIAFFYPKDAGGGTCGFCGPGEYKWIEYNCLGFKQSYYPQGCLDCATNLLCYGIVYGPKICYDKEIEPRNEIFC